MDRDVFCSLIYSDLRNYTKNYIENKNWPKWEVTFTIALMRIIFSAHGNKKSADYETKLEISYIFLIYDMFQKYSISLLIKIYKKRQLIRSTQKLIITFWQDLSFLEIILIKEWHKFLVIALFIKLNSNLIFYNISKCILT